MKYGLRNPNIVIGSVILLVFTVMAILAGSMSPFEPREIRITERLESPSNAHYMGTDHLGRDIFTRLLYGIRISLIVGFSVVALCSVAGILLGLVGGYSERYGSLVMRFVDGLMAFPGLILALALVAVLGSRIENIILALGVVYTPRVARVVHSEVLHINALDYVSAAHAIGVGTARILFRHFLPNTVGPVIVQSSFLIAGAVLAEASLSFLGIGLPPGTPSLGVVLSEGRVYLLEAPWITVFPGVIIFVLSMGMNLLGDGLRDMLDPKS